MMPNLRKNNEEEGIQGSPLLNRADASANDEGTPRSTVHAEKFDMSRFSERKENEEESSLRIIIYVVVVIIIGVGLALLVRNLISQDAGTDDPTTTQETENDTNTEVQTDTNLSISTTTKADPDDAPLNEDLMDAPSLAVGNSTASVENVILSAFKYDRYTTFARINMAIDGVESQADLPRIAVNYDSTRNSLSVVFPTEMAVDENLTDTIQINDLVSNVTYNVSTNTFTINVASEFKYEILPTTDGLTIDIKTIAQIEGIEETTDETDTTDESTDNEQLPGETDTDTTDPEVTEPETTEPEKPVTTTPPSGQRLENDFSTSKQYVSGGTSAKNLEIREIYFEDAGSYYEVAFGNPRVAGAENTPYTSAELVKENGVNYVKVTIEGLDAFTIGKEIYNENNIPVTTIASNLAGITVESFENGRAILMFELKKEGEFRLVSIPTVSGLTQVVALQIKD